MNISQRILLSIIPALLLCGCGDTSPSGDTAGAADDRPRLAYVTNGVADFWTIAKAGADTAGVDFDAEVDVLMPTMQLERLPEGVTAEHVGEPTLAQ